jgi:hypothetical protein
MGLKIVLGSPLESRANPPDPIVSLQRSSFPILILSIVAMSTYRPLFFRDYHTVLFHDL